MLSTAFQPLACSSDTGCWHAPFRGQITSCSQTPKYASTVQQAEPADRQAGSGGAAAADEAQQPHALRYNVPASVLAVELKVSQVQRAHTYQAQRADSTAQPHSMRMALLPSHLAWCVAGSASR